MALTTGSNTGSQTTTDSPQSTTTATLPGAKTGNVQTGTANSLLTSTNGVPLHAAPLTTVSLSTTSAGTAVPTPVKPHHVNVPLISISVLLFVVAAASFWATARSAKTTTK
ncbi:MAG TPA: hypothetical protein VG992_00920 [Candidatus Saccharimonadales bacterium]|nr:hypothetical protein [Candidatus Saccharimonadales bacterium]